MDAEFWLNGICFKWNRKKATSNLRDHHIAFELACEVFFDPFIRWLSSEMVDREERETVVGLTTGWMSGCGGARRTGGVHSHHFGASSKCSGEEDL